MEITWVTLTSFRWEELLTCEAILDTMKLNIHSRIFTLCFFHEQILSSVLVITFNLSLGSSHSYVWAKSGAILCPADLWIHIADLFSFYYPFHSFFYICFHKSHPCGSMHQPCFFTYDPIFLVSAPNAFFLCKCDPTSAQIPTWTSIARSSSPRPLMLSLQSGATRSLTNKIKRISSIRFGSTW